MRTSPSLALLWCISLGFAVSAPAQQAPTSPPASSAQANTLLQQSLTAQTGGTATTDITLKGTVTFMHGAQTESGPMTLTALAVGTTKVEFDLPSGTRTEVWSSDFSGPARISGSGPNGTNVRAAGGSVAMPSPAWFSPAVLTNMISGTAYANSYVGQEMRNGANVQHISVWQTSLQGTTVPASIAKQQTQSEVYLDPSTALTYSMVFQVRPSPPPGSSSKPLSIRARPAQEEVRFSNYQAVQGRLVPLHIQLLLGPSPNQQQIMDITISSTQLNSGAIIAVPATAGN